MLVKIFMKIVKIQVNKFLKNQKMLVKIFMKIVKMSVINYLTKGKIYLDIELVKRDSSKLF